MPYARYMPSSTAVVTARNTALVAVRTQLKLSQDEFAHTVREAGDWLGEPNNCTKRQVQYWEAGTMPRPPYIRAITFATGMTPENLGFTAAEELGVDVSEAMPQAEPWLPVPDPRARTGPLTGIWVSTYEYPSSGRGGTFTGRHYVVLIQHGMRLQARSVPAAGSRLRIDFTVDGSVLTGTWREETRRGGYYHGAVYHGAIQVITDATARRLAGTWVGYGKNGEMNTGPWSLEMVSSQVTPATIDEFNKDPGDD